MYLLITSTVFNDCIYILYFLLLPILTCFNNWNLDLTVDTFYIQWFVNFCNLYLDQMGSEINIFLAQILETLG
jgi:hypothetical protein